MTVTAQVPERTLTVPPLLHAVLAASALGQRRDPNFFKRMAPKLLCLLIVMAAIFPAGPAGGLEGTASWDIELVREYIKNNQGVEMPAEPAAFPGQEKLAELNAEFAARVKALMAIYQAHRGAAHIGVMPDGGLRSRAKQMEIYAECRRIRQVLRQTGFREELAETLADIVPAGDGSQKEHWELDCAGQPPTQAWTSWHNLGLAIDFGYTNNDAYGRMVSAAGDLGMIWGGWFGGRPGGYQPFDALPDATLSPYMRHAAEVLGWDLGHVEWHPGQNDAEKFEAQAGTALDSTHLHMGYEWKLPNQIYEWSAGPTNPTLVVYDLVHEGNSILISKMRHIAGDANVWNGAWMSFDPPVRLFPVYIPTVRFGRDRNHELARGTTRVTEQSYVYGLSSAGGRFKQAYEWQMTWDYSLSFRMTNWPIVANIEILRQDNIRREEARRTNRKVSEVPRYLGYEGFRQVRDTSVYDVEVFLRGEEINSTLLRKRMVDTDGYTTDESGGSGHYSQDLLNLGFRWDRDHGKIGQRLGTLSPHGIDLVEADSSGGGVSASLPAGVFDVASPPPWPPANPRPPKHYGPFLGRP